MATTWLRMVHDMDADRAEFHAFRSEEQAFDWLMNELKLTGQEALDAKIALFDGDYIEDGDYRWDLQGGPNTTDHREEF